MGRAMVARLGLGLLLLALLLPTQAAKCTCGPDLLGATSSVLPVIRRPCKPFLAVRAEISHLPLFRDKGEIITCPTGLCIFREISVIYSNQTTTATPASNPSHNTSTTPSPANTTTKASGGALQSTASVFVISLALLHLYC